MNGGDILSLITVFVLSAFVGLEVISKVPSTLHTPLMSGTNAIHGVVVVGAILVLGTAHGTGQVTLGFIAVDPGHLERRRWLRRDRPDARDVQGAQAPKGERRVGKQPRRG